MNSFEIKKVCADLSGVQCMLVFVHEAVYQAADGCLQLDADGQEGLVTILKQCKDSTQAAIDALRVCNVTLNLAQFGAQNGTVKTITVPFWYKTCLCFRFLPTPNI